MKKLLCILLAATAGTTTVVAQRVALNSVRPVPSATRVHSSVTSANAPFGSAKTTNVITTDTMFLQNNYDSLLFQNSALYAYGVVTAADSGYTFGTNAYGDNGFAEYFYTGYQPDTSIEIIGVVSDWGGVVNPASTNSITFKLWNIDTTIYNYNTNNYITGLPGTVFATSQAVPLTSLVINSSNTPTVTYFNAPVANIMASFFLGYTINYTYSALNGDKIGLRSTPDGTGFGPGYYQTDGQGDTLYYSQNAVYTTSNTWLDGYLDLYRNVNLSLLPIYFIDPTTSVKGVTKSNLTMFGCYPNPTINSTNIQYSLQQPADVTIQIVDAAGRTMTTIQQPAQATGSHVVNVPTTAWPAGNYVYIARTSTGAAIASQLTVMK